MNKSVKKGFVHASSDKPSDFQQKCNAVHAAWWYNWNYKPIDGVEGEFVPMVWGRIQLHLNTCWQEIKQLNCKYLLAFNEPDMKTQANISANEAVNYWPQLLSVSKILGSPATTVNVTGSNSWLHQFMNGVKQNHLKEPDFIAIHMYHGVNVSSYLNIVDTLYKDYKLPIWITELSVANFSGKQYPEQQVYDLMTKLIPELEKRDYVHRYCWKERTPSDPHMGTSSLFDAHGQLTALGKLYASF